MIATLAGPIHCVADCRNTIAIRTITEAVFIATSAIARPQPPTYCERPGKRAISCPPLPRRFSVFGSWCFIQSHDYRRRNDAHDQNANGDVIGKRASVTASNSRAKIMPHVIGRLVASTPVL